MRKLIRKILNKYGYDIVKLPPRIGPHERNDLKKLFSRIYHENMWGGVKGEFNSGPGSDEFVGVEYAKVIKEYIQKHHIKSIVDIGCGDFRIARQFITDDIDYTGIDVVPSLIANNQRLYGKSNIRFLNIDATREDIPDAALCTIRQVLQHLSNDHIRSILLKCKKYPHLIVSEHVLTGDGVIPNLDMQADWNTRIEMNSCVMLEEAPYNAKTELLLEVDPLFNHHPNSRIRTSRVFL
jgi:SAM-dependent methyltransferase